MPHLEQPRTPLTPQEVELAFEYLLAVQDPSEHAVSAIVDRTNAVPTPTYLLMRLAEDIIRPVTDVAADADLGADSFALDEVGGVLPATLEEWTRECVPSALWGVANTIIRFTENLLRREGEDIVDTLKMMRAEHLAMAAAFHGAHRWPHHRGSGCAPGAVVRTHPVRTESMRIGWSRCSGAGRLRASRVSLT
jgi:hypothetical protein